VTVRLWVPVVSHPPAKPPQPPQEPVVVEPQLVPSVSRVHAPVSDDDSTVQVPALQRGVITVRDQVPDSPHVPANPPHALHAPVLTAPQSASPAHSSQLAEPSLQNEGHVGSVSVQAPSAPQRSSVVQ
jgi:hypothetical protein